MATTFPNKQQIRISNTDSYFYDLEVNLERVLNCVHRFSFKLWNSADSDCTQCFNALADQVVIRFAFV